ncbi:MAG: 3-deoxy-D-manno-octulosonic acid kinase [Brachymonas sp.]|nr:3-deoxy-D-manno-octulosonic acid kinase [Brachymonas sp.]
MPVIVPRHPQRFEAVAQWLNSQSLRVHRASLGGVVAADAQVILVDAMGQLQQWYRLAVVSMVGGSWHDVGGHNPLEALAVGQAVIFGPHTENFHDVYAQIEQDNLGQRCASLQQAWETAITWLQDSQLANSTYQQRSMRARQFMQTQQGSAARTLVQLLPWLPKGLAASESFVDVTGATQWAESSQQPNLPNHWWSTSEQPGLDVSKQTTAGRGRVRIMSWHSDTDSFAIARHYQRGGLVAKLMDDRFLHEASHRSRAMREWQLLREMRSQGLPVAQPLAARYAASGIVYRADLLMAWIPDTCTLAQAVAADSPLLKTHAFRAQPSLAWQAVWQSIGQAVARLHAAQVHHSDLNAHNILVQTECEPETISRQVFIIDFDRCERRADAAFKAENLQRLLRSLRKEHRLGKAPLWDETHWLLLTQAYNAFAVTHPA